MMSQEAFMQKVNEITAANTERSQQSANAMMKFQAEMSNTAHQREVEDLRAAGLNPMLSVNNGASTPNGAMAQVDMSGAGALAQWNSASAALQGALANAGAIIRSAELSYQAQKDFANTWPALVDRLLDKTGLNNAIANNADRIPGVRTIKDFLNTGRLNGKSLITDALRGIGITTGNLGLFDIANRINNFTSADWVRFKNWISTHWQRYIINAGSNNSQYTLDYR